MNAPYTMCETDIFKYLCRPSGGIAVDCLMLCRCCIQGWLSLQPKMSMPVAGAGPVFATARVLPAEMGFVRSSMNAVQSQKSEISALCNRWQTRDTSCDLWTALDSDTTATYLSYSHGCAVIAAAMTKQMHWRLQCSMQRALRCQQRQLLLRALRFFTQI